MATKLYDVVVKTGTYTDGQGQEKGRYENVGSVMQGDNGSFLMLKRTFNPAGVPDLNGRGGDSVLLSLYQPQQNQQQGQQPQQQQQAPQQQQQQQQQQQGGNNGVPF